VRLTIVPVRSACSLRQESGHANKLRVHAFLDV
jgi:hypothetical protein